MKIQEKQIVIGTPAISIILEAINKIVKDQEFSEVDEIMLLDVLIAIYKKYEAAKVINTVDEENYDFRTHQIKFEKEKGLFKWNK